MLEDEGTKGAKEWVRVGRGECTCGKGMRCINTREDGEVQACIQFSE